MPNIKQSISWWCYADRLSPEALIRAAAEAGYMGIELIEEEHFPLVKQHGLAVVSVQAHYPLEDGLNKRENAARIQQQTQERIQLAEQWNIPNLICFSGNRNGLDDQTGAEITAENLRPLAQMAEDAGVLLILETLNSKVDHPDFQCDHTEWAVKVCQMVDSPSVKILYDIYHMQVMEGDLMATLEKYHQYIGHYHTAGCPGRHEIDDSQEINYPAIMRAILKTGYAGYVGQEFVPVGDPIQALQQAYQICDV